MYLDYANFKLDLEGLRAEVIAADAVIMREPLGSVLVLIDLRETAATGSVVAMFKESSKYTTPYIRKHALIGITGMKRYLADKVAKLTGRPMRLFTTAEEAFEWLTSDRAAVLGEGDVIGVHREMTPP